MSSLSILAFTYLKYLDDKGAYVTPDKGRQVTPIKQYQENLRSIVATLQTTGAKLIFATTTPVPSGNIATTD
jgi:acyl-CoA thioesterase-1